MSRNTIRAVLIAGPTASGKSALALDLARATGGVIVNADSMQVYRDLRVLTARPTIEEEATVPHRLYGHRDAAENCSVGLWLADATSVLDELRRQDKLAIVVGGTGLYFKALTQGLAAVPPTPAHVREAVRARLDAQGIEALHAELAHRDPVMAARLNVRDRARVSRALEVMIATGRSLAEWHSEGLPPPLPPEDFVSAFLAPERAQLFKRIDSRFDAMIEAGALREVEALARRHLDPILPAMKAHGVPWLIRHLAGEISLPAARTAAQADTRHYAKRQFTWFRHQLGHWPQMPPADAGAWLTAALGR